MIIRAWMESMNIKNVSMQSDIMWLHFNKMAIEIFTVE